LQGFRLEAIFNECHLLEEEEKIILKVCFCSEFLFIGDVGISVELVRQECNNVVDFQSLVASHTQRAPPHKQGVQLIALGGLH